MIGEGERAKVRGLGLGRGELDRTEVKGWVRGWILGLERVGEVKLGRS